MNHPQPDRILRTGRYLVHLLDCVIRGTKPQEIPADLNFGEVCAMAERHSVANLAWYGVERLEVQPPGELKEYWQNLRDQQVVRAFTQVAELEGIIQALTARGIPLLPVKGSLLRSMYPQEDFRTMADLDILAPPERMPEVRDALEDLGYTVQLYDRGSHDVYHKLPAMNIEMHRSLMPDRVSYQWYYDNARVWAKAVPVPGQPMLFRMTWPEFYIYLIAHYHKHYSQSGSGIRSILDIHIFLQAHGTDLDQSYLTEEMTAIGLEAFRRQSEAMARYWFGHSGSPDEDLIRLEGIEAYIFGSGTYGTVDNHVRHGLENEGSRLRYALKRTFLPLGVMKNQYPVLKRVPCLLPVCWGHRLIKGLLTKPERIRLEIDLIRENRNQADEC